ncbi:microtubule-actin cross-linking factor 1 isoform X15 [Tachysurus ichikawai]
MSSSDEESLSERSCVSERSFRSERSGGSLSPCPQSTSGPKGDTLPWNLSKHERRKRKSQDSVLDPAERAVVRVAAREETKIWTELYKQLQEGREEA